MLTSKFGRYAISFNRKLRPYSSTATFVRCQTGELGLNQTLEIVKQLYCFSVFFERLLTRRITEDSSRGNSPRDVAWRRGQYRNHLAVASTPGRWALGRRSRLAKASSKFRKGGPISVARITRPAPHGRSTSGSSSMVPSIPCLSTFETSSETTIASSR